MKYSVKAASIATGVSESSLRTWERRYGIPKPERSATGRRLYDEGDLTIIRRMAALVGAGFPPSEAAVAAQTEGSAPARPPSEEEAPEHPLTAELHEASLAYDEPRTVAAIREAVRLFGWDHAFDKVLFPTMRRIGQYWGENMLESANEHFTSEVVRREMATATGVLPLSQEMNGAVLIACPEDERHELGALAMNLLLRRRGVRVVFLGADVPLSDLLLAIQQTSVEAICLSATSRSGLASLGRAARVIVSARVAARLFVGGPAFAEEHDNGTIVGTLLPQSLPAAADLVATALAEGRTR